MEVTKWLKPSISVSRIGGSASVQAATRVNAEQALYGVCQEVLPAQRIFSPSSVSLFDLKARFFVPTRALLTAARAGAVKVGRRTNLSACSALARPYLDGSEHDGTLDAIGTTIRGELAMGRESSRRNLVFGRSIET